MPLVTASQFQLVPDVGGAISRGLQVGGQFQAIQTQRQAQAQAEQKQKYQNIAVNALKLQGLPVEAQIKELERQQTQSGLTGQVSPESQELLALLKEGKTEQANQFITKAVDIGQRLGVIEAPAKPAAPESIINVVYPGGRRQAFRKGDPNLDVALSQGATQIGQTLQAAKIEAFAAPKGAQAALFKDVVAGQRNIDQINQIETLYEPEFLSFKGAAKGALATFLNKLDPDQRSQFQQRRAQFKSAANRNFLAFRKWATGVAGGEKEMAEIKRATFSEDDSPQDFEAKIQFTRSLYRRLNARNQAALKEGIDNEKAFRQYIKINPLSNTPTIQQRGEQLEQQGFDQGQIIEMLKQEGYIRQ